MSRQKSERNRSKAPDPDPLPWAAIIDKYRRPLRYWIGLRVTNTADAEDVVAEVYLGVAKAARDGTIQSAGHAGNLLFRLARHRVVDYFRRRGAASPVYLGDAEADIVDPSILEENDRWQQYNAEDIQMALTKLSAREREILLLKYHEGMTGAEIAAVYEVPVHTAFAALYKAQAALKKLLEGQQGR